MDQIAKFFFSLKKLINFFKIKIWKIKSIFTYKQSKSKFYSDDDDKFLKDGLDIILSSLKTKKNKFYVFGTLVKKNNLKVINSIPPDINGNFISITADLGIKTDMKQTVDSKLLKKLLKKIKIKRFERDPTGLIWAKASYKLNCIFVNKPVVLKEYFKDGITHRINLTKFKSPIHMKNLYWIIIRIKHKSNIFRLLSLINFIRYSILI